MALFLGVAVFFFELATLCCVGAGAAVVRVRGEERGVVVEKDVSLARVAEEDFRVIEEEDLCFFAADSSCPTSSGSSRASAVLRHEPADDQRLALQRASAASGSCTAAAARLLLRPALFIWTLPSVCGVKVAEAAATELLLRT